MNQAVSLVSITHGADLQIDLSHFAEPYPVFGYADDLGTGVIPLSGLNFHGEMAILDQPDYRWLTGPRNAILLKVTRQGRQDGRVLLRSQGLGEFCLEVYHLGTDQSISLIYQDDYCFK
ncbi:MAG: hypothetical protein AAF191_12690 [Verrucomicrobiota bacterium]